MGGVLHGSDWLNIGTFGMYGATKTLEKVFTGKDLNSKDWFNIGTGGMSGLVEDVGKAFSKGRGGDESTEDTTDIGQFKSDVQGIKKRRLTSSRGYLSTIRKREGAENQNLLASSQQGSSTLG